MRHREIEEEPDYRQLPGHPPLIHDSLISDRTHQVLLEIFAMPRLPGHQGIALPHQIQATMTA